MNKQNLMPQPAQPVNRFTTGQLPPELAELSEEALADTALGGIEPSFFVRECSYDGDDTE